MSYITGRSANAQVGTSYTISDGDHDKLVTYSNAAAIAVTLPQAGTSSQFGPGWTSHHQSIGTGTVTITPTTSTINGFTSITLFQWQFCTITSDGANYKALIQPLSSTDQAANVSGYLAADAGTGAAHNQIILRNINTGVNSQRKAMNIYLEHDGAVAATNYNGLMANVGFTTDGFTNKSQGQTDVIEVVGYGAVANATFTSVANASGGSTVYTGTIQNGANNGLAGLTYTIAGFTNGANNGVFTCSASTSTTMTVNNAAGVSETHAGTATPLTTFTLTSVANHSGSTTVYTGTIPNGGSNFYNGWDFRISGFTTAANNGFFLCSASTTATLTLNNANGVSETYAASAIWYTIGELNIAALRWGCQQSGNIINHTAILQYLPSVQANSNIENFTGFAIDAPAGGGSIWNFVGVEAGSNLNSMANVASEVGIIATATSNPSVVAYAILAEGKTASIVADDSTVASSFIGHGVGVNSGGAPNVTLHDGWYGKTGSPEGVVSANVGSVFSRQDSTIGDAFYLKANGSGNTGWSPVDSIGPIKTVSTTYSTTNSDSTINANGTFTITLANTGVPTGKRFYIKNIGTGTVTISSAANIDGTTTVTLNTQYQAIIIQWDGTQYWITDALPSSTVTPKQFGAAVDGITNDTAAIVAMFAAATANGVTSILFEDGVCMTDYILVPSNMYIHGTSWKAVWKFRQVVAGDFLDLGGSTNVTFDNMTLDGNYTSPVTTAGWTIDIGSQLATHRPVGGFCTVRNCQVFGNGFGAIVIENGGNCIIDHNTVTATTDSCIAGVVIWDSTITNNTTYGASFGISVSVQGWQHIGVTGFCTNNIISGNICYATKASSYSFEFDGTHGCQVSNNVAIVNGGEWGFRLEAFLPSPTFGDVDVTMLNNNFSNNSVQLVQDITSSAFEVFTTTSGVYDFSSNVIDGLNLWADSPQTNTFGLYLDTPINVKVGNLSTKNLGTSTVGLFTDLSAMSNANYTPTPTGFTVVGTPTITGHYSIVGNLCFVTIVYTSTTSVSGAYGTSNITLPFTAARIASGSIWNNDNGTVYGAALQGGTLYVGSFAATSGVTISGVFELA